MVSRRSWLAALAGGATASVYGGAWASLQEAVLAAKRLLVRSEDPYNAEPSLQELVASYITPLPLFYVRSHAPHPQIDAQSFRLRVTGLVKRDLSLSLEQIQQDFPRRSVLATLTCAGNRRQEHSRTKPVGGVAWDAGAIGTATWGGAALKDILQRAGLQDGARHVWFEGLDAVPHQGATIGFGGSIPLQKALAGPPELPEALAVYAMNGQPLPVDHGFPLRTIVPGYIGARSVKWLGKIMVSDQPSPNHFLAGAYKLVTEDNADAWRASEPLYEYRLNSAICAPAANAEIVAGKVRVRGYALPDGGGRQQSVAAVRVSTDGGAQWTTAPLLDAQQPFCWRRWEVEAPVAAGVQEVIVQATDQDGQAQPATTPWNLKGYMYNAWHHVPLKIVSS